MRYSEEQMRKAFCCGIIFERDTRTGLPGIPFDEWLSVQKEDVCEFTYDGRPYGRSHRHYNTACGQSNMHKDGEYCPACGKRIEVKA